MVGTYGGVRWGIIIEKGEDPCSTCFDGAARDWNGMVGNDLATAIILLVIDAETHHVSKAWVLTELCKGDGLSV